MCTTGDISCVIGYAGSGKSYILAAVREAFSSQGYKVKGAALAAITAEGLQHESGICQIKSELLHIKKSCFFNTYHLIVIIFIKALSKGTTSVTKSSCTV
ncbi:MAG: AAA family ATPase [Desulfobacteraceae bacterium]|nr:AAA family ATPase [Desulfobacteraceae bacterium]